MSGNKSVQHVARRYTDWSILNLPNRRIYIWKVMNCKKNYLEISSDLHIFNSPQHRKRNVYLICAWQGILQRWGEPCEREYTWLFGNCPLLSKFCIWNAGNRISNTVAMWLLFSSFSLPYRSSASCCRFWAWVQSTGLGGYGLQRCNFLFMLFPFLDICIGRMWPVLSTFRRYTLPLSSASKWVGLTNVHVCTHFGLTESRSKNVGCYPVCAYGNNGQGNLIKAALGDP
jgi:hypothetical protein